MSIAAGIILCGGQSRRMGQPKEWLPLGNEPMLSRIARILGESLNPLVVAAGPGQRLPPLPHSTLMVRDRHAGGGPLEGFVAGLEALHGQRKPIYLCGCDCPFPNPHVIIRLMELLDGDMACIPYVHGRLQPLASVYRPEVLHSARGLLAEGVRSVRSLSTVVSTRCVSATELRDVDPDLVTFWGVNTPEEYHRALNLLQPVS